MNSDWDERYLNRFDSVSIDIRDDGRPGFDPPNDPEIRWRVEVPDFDGHRDEPALAVLDALRGADGRTPPHILEDSRNYHSWGASGAAHQVIVHLATLAGDVALLHVLRRLAGRVRKPPFEDLDRPRPVDRAEAEERARWHLKEMFDLSDNEADRLAIEDETWSAQAQTWAVRLVGPGVTYDVELEAIGYATVLQVSRSRRAGSRVSPSEG